MSLSVRLHIAAPLAACWLMVLAPCVWAADPVNGVHCQIDQTTFDGDVDVTRIDYVIPPGDKPPRFRLLAFHADDATGNIGVELKFRGAPASGGIALSQEPTWRSVVKLPKKQDSAITSGDFSFSHFEPLGDKFAAGTAQFQTGDGHRGQCRFRLPIEVVNLGH